MKLEENAPRARNQSTVSRRLSDGRLVELLYWPDQRSTRFAVGKGDEIEVVGSVSLDSGETLLPIAPSNNLLQHGAILLPECPEPYGETTELVTEIDAFIARYVDLSPTYREIATAYVLLTWVYDAFNELPYLRLRGDFGTGKTRGLTILGSLCYKAFCATGASTVSPLFYTLDAFRGTLIIDEADFRFSDEKAEVIKILNNGNARGFPVLRQSVGPNREFSPRAFDVYGPKIAAMRQTFDDPALESRFLTENMGQRKLRSDIPINLSDKYKDEARSLRNKLLTYRFRTLGTLALADVAMEQKLSARVSQILRPLLAVVPDPAAQERIKHFAYNIEAELRTDRALATDGMLVEVLVGLFSESTATSIPLSKIATTLTKRFANEFDRIVTPRYVGQLLRKRLLLKTYKTQGVYVVPTTERDKVTLLAQRFGINSDIQP